MSGCKHCQNGWFEGTDVECVNGVLIDIDVAHEGWQRDVAYPLAPCHPDYNKPEDAQVNDSQERLAIWAEAGAMSAPVDTSAEAVKVQHHLLEECSFYVAAALLRALLRERDEVKASEDEIHRLFLLRCRADMRGIKRWQEATGRTLTWPDRADAVVFLLEKLDAAETALATARADALKEAAAWHTAQADRLKKQYGVSVPEEWQHRDDAKNILALISQEPRA